jgi:hypothetical protein
MDVATRRVYIQARLAKAHNDLATARDDLAQGQNRWSKSSPTQTVSSLAWNAIYRR